MRQVEAAFPGWFGVPYGFGVKLFQRVEEFERAGGENTVRHGADWILGPVAEDDEIAGLLWLQDEAMRGNHDQAADAGFGGTQDEHDCGEGGARQEEQRAADAHACKSEQREDDGPELVAVAADGEGVIQTAMVLR